MREEAGGRLGNKSWKLSRAVWSRGGRGAGGDARRWRSHFGRQFPIRKKEIYVVMMMRRSPLRFFNVFVVVVVYFLLNCNSSRWLPPSTPFPSLTFTFLSLLLPSIHSSLPPLSPPPSHVRVYVNVYFYICILACVDVRTHLHLCVRAIEALIISLRVYENGRDPLFPEASQARSTFTRRIISTCCTHASAWARRLQVGAILGIIYFYFIIFFKSLSCPYFFIRSTQWLIFLR